MSSHKRRRTATGQAGGARRPAATLTGQAGQTGQSRQPASATKTGAAVASRPVTRSTTTGTGASGGATVRRTSVHPENYRSRMNRHLRARRQRTQILGTAAAVIVVGALAWLLFTHLPHGATTAKTKNSAAATGPQATLTAAAQAPAACVTPKVPGLNGTATNSGGPPAVKATVQTGTQCLQWVDIKDGTGAAIKAGDTVSVQYTGWLLNGQKFDSSYDHGGTPFQVQNVGNAQVIQGWNMGLIGMKLGGERELIIPPALGYGAPGSPPAIPANATLIFTITVVSIP